MTSENWKSIIQKLKSELPTSAADLSDTYFGYYLWLNDEVDRPHDAANAYRLSLLYSMVDHLGWIPESIYAQSMGFKWDLKRWYIPHPKQEHTIATIPKWLFEHLPDSDGGYLKSRFHLNESWTASYRDPWLALERAALDCPNFNEQASRELDKKGDKEKLI